MPARGRSRRDSVALPPARFGWLNRIGEQHGAIRRDSRLSVARARKSGQRKKAGLVHLFQKALLFFSLLTLTTSPLYNGDRTTATKITRCYFMSDCRKSLKSSRSAHMCQRQRYRQGNFAANCVRGAVLRGRDLP